MTSRTLFDMFGPMWRTIKKWWILQLLDREVARHSTKNDLGGIVAGDVLLDKHLFIEGSPEHAGIITQSYWTVIFPWFDGRALLIREKTKKSRAHDFARIYDNLLEEKLTYMRQTTRGEIPDLNAKGRSYHGHLGLLEMILGGYPAVVAAVIGLGAGSVITLAVQWLVNKL